MSWVTCSAFSDSGSLWGAFLRTDSRPGRLDLVRTDYSFPSADSLVVCIHLWFKLFRSVMSVIRRHAAVTLLNAFLSGARGRRKPFGFSGHFTHSDRLTTSS